MLGYRFAISLLTLLTLASTSATAQAPVALTIDAVAGSIHIGGLCPDERTSASYASIAAAVECAQSGDTLVINAGTYVENVLLDKDLTLTGAGSDSTIIDGGGVGRVFTVENGVSVTLADMTITGGKFDSGAGVYTYGGSVELRGVNITGNEAVSAGAGVYSQTGRVSISDSTIANNALSIYSNSGASASAAGAGVYVYSGELNITNSTLSGNHILAETCGTTPASALGGAVYTHTAAAQIVNSDLSGNLVEATACSSSVEATAEGVGLYTFAGTITVDGGTITDAGAMGEMGVITGLVIAAVPTATPVMPVVSPTVEMTPEAVSSTPVPPASVASPLGEVDGQIAMRWMEAVQAAVQRERLSPPVAARVYAYAGVTLYEAVVPGMPGYRSLAGQLNGLQSLPQPDPMLTYDWPLVANSALTMVYVGLFESASEESLVAFSALRDAVEFERGETVPVNTFNRSREYGQMLGQAILDWATTDNYAVTRSLSYSLPSGSPAFWVPLEGQQPLEPYWGTLRPFALPLASYCDIPLDVPFSAEAASEFYAQADEIYATTAELSPDEQAIATFWADAPGDTSTPPGHWISIQNQMVEQLDLDLGRAAEMYALTGLALGDAFISAWDTKYRVQLVRPVTYIRTYIDPNWSSFIGTPPFPEYPSGHSVASGAAAVVLESLLGTVPFDDLTHLSRALPPRSFTSFGQAADEAAMSRMYGGIHYRFSIENGLEQGRCVGQHVLTRVQLHQP